MRAGRAARPRSPRIARPGRLPIAIVATLGTTSSTSVDPVAAIADIAEREGLWLHVDAAYAGPVAMLPERRAPFAGWERADSIVVNPHKWLFTPLDASLLLTRRMDVLRAAFSLVPEYLRTLDRDTPVHDYNEYTPQLGRRFRALKLWIQLRWFGLEGLRRRIEAHLGMAEAFAGWVDADPRLGAPGARPVLDGLLPLATGAARDLDEAALDEAQRGDHGCRQSDRRGLPVAHPARRSVHDPRRDRQPADASRATSSGPGRCCARPPRAVSPSIASRTTSCSSPTPEELRDWFDANHATADEPVARLPPEGQRACRASTWSQVVDEALCVGWIDGVRKSLDDDVSVAAASRHAARAASGAPINVAKVAEPDDEGRMRPAGLAAFEARTRERTAIYSYERPRRPSPTRRPRAFGPTTPPGPTGSADRRRTGGP